MNETRQLVIDTARRIFQDLGDPQTINAAKDTSWKRPLWIALEEAGLTQPRVGEDLGGAGLSVSDSMAIMRTAGAFAVPVPLAETLIASALLWRGKMISPMGPMTLAPVRLKDRITLNSDGSLSGTASKVPFATDCDHIVVVAGDTENKVHVALVELSKCAITSKPNKAGEGRDVVCFDGVMPHQSTEVPSGVSVQSTITFGAMVRATQIAGALEALMDMSVQYAGERVAFEKPIAKFQAVQHNLARLAEEAASAVAITNSAARTHEDIHDADNIFLEVASAKIRAGEAAGEGAAIAAQVHGAIGFTDEHILHRYSHRLWEWRDDFGGESEWALKLGEAYCKKGGDQMWPSLTAG